MKPFVHQYLVISHGGTMFNTPWLMFPEWDEVLSIVDLSTGRYVTEIEWERDGSQPNWQEVEEDCL